MRKSTSAASSRVVVPERGAGRETYRLADVAWIELRRSLLVSHLRLHGERERAWPSSSLVPVLALFRPLRQRLANAGPPERRRDGEARGA